MKLQDIMKEVADNIAVLLTPLARGIQEIARPCDAGFSIQMTWTGLMWTGPRSIDWHVLSDAGAGISDVGRCSGCSTVTWAICQNLPLIMFEAISKFCGIQHFHQVKILGLAAGPPIILVILYDAADLVRVLYTNI